MYAYKYLLQNIKSIHKIINSNDKNDISIYIKILSDILKANVLLISTTDNSIWYKFNNASIKNDIFENTNEKISNNIVNNVDNLFKNTNDNTIFNLKTSGFINPNSNNKTTNFAINKIRDNDTNKTIAYLLVYFEFREFNQYNDYDSIRIDLISTIISKILQYKIYDKKQILDYKNNIEKEKMKIVMAHMTNGEKQKMIELFDYLVRHNTNILSLKKLLLDLPTYTSYMRHYIIYLAIAGTGLMILSKKYENTESERNSNRIVYMSKVLWNTFSSNDIPKAIKDN